MSKEELHAAPLSGKRLLALWNALPGVEKRGKGVGDREAIIELLWAAIEVLPDGVMPQDQEARNGKMKNPHRRIQQSTRVMVRLGLLGARQGVRHLLEY